MYTRALCWLHDSSEVLAPDGPTSQRAGRSAHEEQEEEEAKPALVPHGVARSFNWKISA